MICKSSSRYGPRGWLAEHRQWVLAPESHPDDLVAHTSKKVTDLCSKHVLLGKRHILKLTTITWSLGISVFLRVRYATHIRH